MTIRESDLPGIGRKFQLETRAGDRLVVIVHDDGRREIYRNEDPEESSCVATLDDTEARQLAAIIGGMMYQPRALESAEMAFDDLVIEWLKLERGAWGAGKSIGDLHVRGRTGANVIAIVRKDHEKRLNPGPDTSLEEEDTLVVVGDREQIRALKHLLMTGTT